MCRDSETNISPHRVTNKIRLFQAHALHPRQQPGSCIIQNETVEETAHCSKARQVYQIDAVAPGKRRDVARPPAGGSREPMYQDDRLPLARNLVIHRGIPHPNLTLDYFDNAPPCEPPSGQASGILLQKLLYLRKLAIAQAKFCSLY